MKKILSLVMCLAMLFALSSSAMAFNAGTYEGEAQSFGGPLKVAVTVSETAIEKIEVISHGDTQGISDAAYAKVPEAIIAGQSVAVDTVAGCTVSSKGIIDAVTAALLASGATEEEITKEVVAAEAVPAELEEKTADVVIIGAGGAGMTAAVEVLRAGGSVIVVDKMPSVGGNTIAAGSALNASGTAIQKNGTMTETGIAAVEEKLALEPKNDDMKRWQESVRKDMDAYLASGENYVFDSTDLHKLQTFTDGDYLGKTEMIEILCNGAPEAIKFLEELGMQWKPTITAAVGATWTRSHQPANIFGGAGNDFVFPQVEYVKANGGEIILEHKAEELIVEDDRVVGVKGMANDGTPFEYRANKSVIMATGGFSANVEMRQKYNKHWATLDESLGTTNQPCATGDGIAMADAIGANLVGMEWIQLLTGANSKLNASIDNSIFVNKNGERFVAEDARRDVLASTALSQEDATYWYIYDAHTAWDVQGGYTSDGAKIEDLVADGKIVEAQTVEDLAAQLGVNADNLQKAIDQFNKAAFGEQEDVFGRQVYQYPLDKAPYYACTGFINVHHTMGGIEINEQAQVLDVNGNVIPGFFAAGEVTGGIHGGNRLGGNAIADIVVFGRIAGQNAMK